MLNKPEKSRISVVIPVYGCRECLYELVRRLENSLGSIAEDWEIIMVNDACPDGSWLEVKEISDNNESVIGINLSRNFGQHCAITAGLDYACGDWVVVMDCDLQDNPEDIPRLYAKAQEGYDIVLGRRLVRQDNFFKKLSSKIYYRIFDYFTEQKSDFTIANFGIYSEKVIRNFRNLKEQNRSFPLFIRWLGFNYTKIDVEHSKRFAGKTSYNLVRLISLAMDSIVSQSNKPLKISIKLGFSISMFSFIYACYLIFRYYYWTIPVTGWTSIMVSLYFLSGLIMINMGILGLYLGKVFNEAKGRPLYVIKEVVGQKRQEPDL